MSAAVQFAVPIPKVTRNRTIHRLILRFTTTSRPHRPNQNLEASCRSTFMLLAGHLAALCTSSSTSRARPDAQMKHSERCRDLGGVQVKRERTKVTRWV